jgi:endoglucanase
MRNKVLVVFFITSFLVMSCSNYKLQVVDNIRLNSIGYLPTGNKIATIITDSCNIFYLKSVENHKIKFEGKTKGPIFQKDVNQTAWIADFSDFSETGDYYIEIPDVGKSVSFSVRTDIYNQVFKTAFRGFYLLRCGTEIRGQHKSDTFYHAPCHMDDGWLTYTEFGNIHKDGTGGWHDAGDYGKYTVNAGITMSNLFMAWENFHKKIEKINLDLPETAPNYPEYLKELKWETDFLLKMQYPDGSGRVSHKLTRVNFEGLILPEEDKEKRYFSDWGSNATANFAATMALASRIFSRYDKEYADTCLEAAKLSYNFLKANPEYKRWEQEEIRTGPYQAHDSTARLWAAAELWETTGEASYLKDFEAKALLNKNKIELDWDWGNVKNLAMFTYLLSGKKGKNNELFQSIRQELIDIADSVVNHTEKDIYGRPFSKYYWGCNGTVARLALNLYVANKLNPDSRYEEAAHQIIAHLFGRNYYGRSFVTGVGINPPMFPHDRRSAGDSVSAPWPGYLVGGGHSAIDWVDDQNSYSHNEIAINWQSALVFTLSWFTGETEN